MFDQLKFDSGNFTQIDTLYYHVVCASLNLSNPLFSPSGINRCQMPCKVQTVRHSYCKQPESYLYRVIKLLH